MALNTDQDLLPSADDTAAMVREEPGLFSLALRHPSIIIGGILLVIIVLIAIIGPFLTLDPIALNPIKRLKAPGEFGWFGTDYLGRDVFSRVIHGARVSLVVGLAVSICAITLGLVTGLLAV